MPLEWFSTTRCCVALMPETLYIVLNPLFVAIFPIVGVSSFSFEKIHLIQFGLYSIPNYFHVS